MRRAVELARNRDAALPQTPVAAPAADGRDDVDAAPSRATNARFSSRLADRMSALGLETSALGLETSALGLETSAPGREAEAR